MPISYSHAPDIDKRIKEIVIRLGMKHIDIERVHSIRSRGSKSRRTLARCHTLSRIFQKAFGTKGHYIVEVISERFDRLSHEDQTRVLIHELAHIPKTFGGGFRHHKPYVTNRVVEKMYREYLDGK